MTEENKKNYDLTIFESIAKDVAISDAKVPLAKVFGHGELGNKESFGGRSIIENSELVDAAFENTKELQDIWNHSHSQWVWGHINLSWKNPLHNLRSVTAELSAKKAALNSAKWDQVRTQFKYRKLQDKLKKGSEEGTLDYWKEIELKINLAELQEGIAEGNSYIEGAMKDVLALNNYYEQLKEQVGGFNEVDIEKEESKNHLRRSLTQCIRDVRQQGSISKGEQEYMEQIGVNPSKIQKAIKIYVKSEEDNDDWSVAPLHEFVNQMVDELIDYYKVAEKVMDLKGLKSEIVEEYININKVALPNPDNGDA